MISRMKGHGDGPGIGPKTPPLKSRVDGSQKRPAIRTFVRSGQEVTVPNPPGRVPSPRNGGVWCQKGRQDRDQAIYSPDRKMVAI